ncbi:hypothetical protein PsorP6_016976 [Peronosclerospora sorghi]|uniref:Uncharacterized protein n=1 Tax=Peronosclerospora sorghi TaxID=230839 RepID=A0ACC0WBQ6_9STRA|nr:hypothetical protein PsorP6_016976 [Peronosclerospora sorghi]
MTFYIYLSTFQHYRYQWDRQGYAEGVQSESRRANQKAASDEFREFPDESPNDIRGIQDGKFVLEGPGIEGTEFRIEVELDLEFRDVVLEAEVDSFLARHPVAQAEILHVDPAVEEDLAAEEDPVAEEDPAAAEPEEEVAAFLKAYFWGNLFSIPDTAYDALTAECICRGFDCTIEKRTNKDIEPGRLRERTRRLT